MNPYDFLTEDGHAVLLLCSALALPKAERSDAAAPYTLAEWNQLARRIQTSRLQHPSALVGQSTNELADALGVVPTEAERIGQLLARGGRAALELESLFSRGLWALTRADPSYPAQLRARLKHQAPTVLFGTGETALLKQAGVAVVGSRQIDEAGQQFAQRIGQRCAQARVPVVSGGARGTDSLAMEAAIEAGGTAFGVLADSLERAIRQPDLRQLLLDDRLVLVTPYLPTAGFSIGAAMGRNKIIYGLADYAVIVSSDLDRGGTWAGATEALKAAWCPVFVRADSGVPPGNLALIKKGASAITGAELVAVEDLLAWFRYSRSVSVEQADLFAGTPHARPTTKPKQPKAPAENLF